MPTTRLRTPAAAVLALPVILTTTGCSGHGTAGAGRLALWIGTYTDAGSHGIYHCEFDTGSGELGEPVLAGESANPSFLALHPSGRFLYAVNELTSFGGERSGAVSAFAVDTETGRLTVIDQRASGGADPCHIIVDAAGRNVLVANYTGGSVTVMPLAEDGRLWPAAAILQLTGSGPDAKRQEAPHAHQIVLDPSGRFALAADLGSDRVLVYRYDPERGILEPGDPPAAALAPGSGPRHLAWHPSGRHVYVIGELASTVTVMTWDAEQATLDVQQTVATVPRGFSAANTAAEVAVSADGRFLYASNRGDDSLAVFTIDAAAGTLTAAGRAAAGGRTPRHFVIDPTGRWLLVAHQDSDTIAVFRIDPVTGFPSPVGRTRALSRPVCLVFAAEA